MYNYNMVNTVTIGGIVQKIQSLSEWFCRFVNGQVITLRYKGQRRLVNMKSATSITIYKTDAPIRPIKNKSMGSIIKSTAFQKNECTLVFLGKLKTSKSAPQSTSLLQKALQRSKAQVFVVMKFGDDILESAYTAVYRPVIQKFGLECLRIDEVQDSGQISEQILEAIATSKYISGRSIWRKAQLLL